MPIGMRTEEVSLATPTITKLSPNQMHTLTLTSDVALNAHAFAVFSLEIFIDVVPLRNELEPLDNFLISAPKKVALLFTFCL